MISELSAWFSSHGSLFSLSTEAWHLSQLMLLFVTQAAMELDSRGLLALLLLSLLLGKDGKMVMDDWWMYRAVETHDFPCFWTNGCHVDPWKPLVQVSGGLLQHSEGNWNDGDHLCRDGWGHPCQHGIYGLQIRSYAPTGSRNWAAGGSKLCRGEDAERCAQDANMIVESQLLPRWSQNKGVFSSFIPLIWNTVSY